MSALRVTVLMSVHNGGRWLQAAMDSILAQTWRDFEFLILDDASTDASVALIAAVKDERVRLIRLEENIGLTRCLNIGLREARGELIARQDSDDLSAPERLAKQVSYLDSHPQVAAVGSQGRLIDAEGRSRGNRNLPIEAASVRWLSLFDNPVTHSAVMFRAAVITREFGGYDESFSTCQDYELWSRVMERWEIHNLADRLVKIREHVGSVSSTQKSEGAEMVRRVVREVAARRDWQLSESEKKSLVAFRRHLHALEVGAFRRLIDRWDQYFLEKNTDLARTKANLLARVGYNLITSDRIAAAAQLAASIRRFPLIVKDLPWLRIALLFILGEKARNLRGAPLS